MAVFWDKVVPLPTVKGITINRGDGNKVLYVKEAPYDAKAGYAKPKRATIGYITSTDTTKMHPTTGYKLLFPYLWEKYFDEKVPALFRRIGMYAMADAINEMTGFKDIMDEAFGSVDANAILDFCLYSMLFHTSVAEHFDKRMNDQQLFSGNCYSDSFFSELLNHKISYEEILLFKKKWVLLCKEDGIEEVWLCIDGSNDDCESKGVELGEKGHAKSLRNRNIISFTYAVTEKGRPVTFELYRGGLVDAKAMKRILSFLGEAGIKVKGVILDRGYCDSNTLQYLEGEKIPYIIMVKSNPAGAKSIIEKYGSIIRLNAKYIIPGSCLFGVQDKVQLFDNYVHEDYVTLFYDLKNGSDRILDFLKKMNKESERIEFLLKKGDDAVIASKFKNVLRISGDNLHVEIVTDELQKVLDEKGLYAIVSSEELTPLEVHQLYQARNSSETEYMIIKSQLGYGKVRIHATKGVQAKFTIGFIASCIRYELQEAADFVSRSTNEVIMELNMLSMTKMGESYVPIQGIVGRQEQILKKLGTSYEKLKDIAKDENDRLAGRTPTPRHRKTGPNGKPERKKVEATEQKPKESPPSRKRASQAAKKPGIKPGTKRGDFNKDGTPRKKPGVPVGYKRGSTNKDGSPRKKPGPKGKSTVT